MYQYSNVPVQQCTSTAMYQYSNVPVQQCTSTAICQYSNVPWHNPADRGRIRVMPLYPKQNWPINERSSGKDEEKIRADCSLCRPGCCNSVRMRQVKSSKLRKVTYIHTLHLLLLPTGMQCEQTVRLPLAVASSD
eukprot:scpid85256/ scgid1209/ 